LRFVVLVRLEVTMPVPVASGIPTLFIRKGAFERVGLTRSQFDERLNLTADEFRVERDLVVIGSIHAVDDLPALLDELERLGLDYFEDFFELSGHWPAWLRLYASSEDGA
jgi:hypothetical protein